MALPCGRYLGIPAGEDGFSFQLGHGSPGGARKGTPLPGEIYFDQNGSLECGGSRAHIAHRRDQNPSALAACEMVASSGPITMSTSIPRLTIIDG